MSDYKKSKSTVVRLHGRSNFISGTEDMNWLRDVHLPGLSKKFKSALIFGNEDSPDRIQVYHLEDPNVYDQPVIYERKVRRR
jgi:hypothetical protein